MLVSPPNLLLCMFVPPWSQTRLALNCCLKNGGVILQGATTKTVGNDRTPPILQDPPPRGVSALEGSLVADDVSSSGDLSKAKVPE